MVSKTKEKSFIRGKLTFWECKSCGSWHEGQIYKCPIAQAKLQVYDECEKLIMQSDFTIDAVNEILKRKKELQGGD